MLTTDGSFGEDFATDLVNLRMKIVQGNPVFEMGMDLHNDAVGRALGGPPDAQ